MPRRYKMKTKPTDCSDNWTKKRDRAMNSFVELKPVERFRRETPEYKSLNVTVSPDSCGKRDSKQYSGSLVKGIATMHKSNAVPVLDEQYAKDLASMRR